jgi:hypothetical protein
VQAVLEVPFPNGRVDATTKKIYPKVMWVGRATVFLVGLAVISCTDAV